MNKKFKKEFRTLRKLVNDRKECMEDRRSERKTRGAVLILSSCAVILSVAALLLLI